MYLTDTDVHLLLIQILGYGSYSELFFMTSSM